MSFLRVPWLIVCATILVVGSNNIHHVFGMTMEQVENMAKGIRNVCVGKTGVDPAVVQGMKKGEFPEDEKLQCYIKCVASTLKTWKNGRLQLDSIMKQVSLLPVEFHERTIAAAKHCVNFEYSADPCVACWEYVRCQYNQDPDIFFFP